MISVGATPDQQWCAESSSRTGIEMVAIAGASVVTTALCDMYGAADRSIRIDGVRRKGKVKT